MGGIFEHCGNGYEHFDAIGKNLKGNTSSIRGLSGERNTR
ncbi:MAG: hypothetical protein CM15mV109_130 [uncultured marine virus]|nr:MAG: hypothetical protein CM15mV109_130 [uncultured marine virus]